MTVAIPLIAGMVVMLFCNKTKKLFHGGIGLFVLMMVSMYGLISLWVGTYEIAQLAKETSDPAINWIALGMKGNGGWEDNKEFSLYVRTLPTKADKIEYAKAYIWENRSDFYNVNHLIQKVRFNFASGNLGTKDYTYYALRPNNIIWELFSPWGKYYWRTSQICFCYIFSIYTVYFLGALLTVISLFRKKEMPIMKRIADMTLLGNMIFLMIWEANNRQLYNQMPVIILGGVMNVRQIISCYSWHIGRNRINHTL